ncbi:hypothetical protein [Candidatus Cyanaurora vandensis]|uniref:hypothetical protein n=1 Tax=Candidatus Cyanaurora vandensis TaxID=2714958 RepID=UPI00257AB3C6|nr:hypothetical protein [Candidatus Cyanaurora vandensis]
MAPDTARSAVRYQSPWGFALFLTALIIAGVGMAYWGYNLGQRAAKNVSVPTSLNLVQPSANQEKAEGFIREFDVLARFQQQEQDIRRQGLGPVPLPDADIQASTGVNLEESDILEPAEVVAAQEQGQASQETTSAGVNLRVEDVQRLANALVLELNLTNQGGTDRRFLYGDAFNLLVVSDDQGRRLSTLTTGLPGDLPADGSTYAGSIEVPIDELGEARYLRVSLADYPDRQVDLVIGSLKVPR